MGLLKKPSELTKASALNVLIYGNPGAGKSTIALSAPNPVLLDFDGGAHRINAAHQVVTLPVSSWEEVQQVIKDGELNEFSTIVIDTAGKMLDCMASYIMRTDPKMKMRDGSLSLKGYGSRKTLFSNFISEMRSLGKNLVFVAHEKEDKDGEVRFIRPEVGSATNLGDLIKDLDLVGYMRMNGYQREICWTGTNQFYGKNACNLPAVQPVASILDKNGIPTADNTFLSGVFDSYNAYLKKQGELRAKFDNLMARANAAIDKIDSLDAANTLWKQFQSVTPVFNSKVLTKLNLDAKCSALGYTFNSVKNEYEQAA